MLVGMLVLLVSIWHAYPGAGWMALMLLPMLADGLIQRTTAYESTNVRRFFTGLLGGYAMLGLILLSLYAVFRFGYGLGLQWRYG